MASYKQQTQRSLDTSPGFLIRAPGMPHKTLLPNWEKETQVRIFPAAHADGGFDCMRDGSDDSNFGNAVWAEPVARSLGVREQFTYVDRILGITGKTPTSRLVEAVSALIEEKPREVPDSWIGWTKGGKGRAAKVQKPRTHVFWQGMEIMRLGKFLLNASGQLQPQFPMLIMGAPSLQMSFEIDGNTRVKEFKGQAPETILGDDKTSRKKRDESYAAMFQLGDWCSIDHGRIMSIFQAPASARFEKPHYALKMLDELPLSGIAATIHQMWVPWDKLLRYFTVEQHMEMLCRAFPPEAVDYTFGTTELRDLMPAPYKDAWKRWLSSQTSWSPGMNPQQFPQQTGAPTPQQAPQPQQSGMGLPANTQTAAAPSPNVQPQMMAAFTAPAPTMTGASSGQVPLNAGISIGGMTLNLSGADVEGAPADTPIMQSAGFATPAEFAKPVGAPAPAADVAPAPTAPAQTQQSSMGTPAAATPAVDPKELASVLAQLHGARTQASRGNA